MKNKTTYDINNAKWSKGESLRQIGIKNTQKTFVSRKTYNRKKYKICVL
jgi:hypothetical protein